MSGSTDETKSENQAGWMRANEAADEFRTLVGILVGALLGIAISSGGSGIDLSGSELFLIGALGIFSLFLLATSWSLQKSKSIAKAESGNKAKFEQWYLTNWYFDQLAFALLLISATFLLSIDADWGIVVSILVGALYLLTVFSIDRAVKDTARKMEAA